jgi:tRNA 2-selenouridine synthase
VAITKLTVESFLELAEKHPVLDVRSPGEYQHAHIPGAYSLPLFTDEERKVVGTSYKKESRQQAIKIGLKYFGKKMVKMVEEVEVLVSSEQWLVHSNKTVLVHCWRGGMRSAGVAWLLDLYGFKVYTLVGGYKMYRRWVLEQFAKDYPFVVIGGYTGSGKTKLLEALKAKGESVIDFEAIACHKGSAFELAKQLRDTGYVIRDDDLGSQPATRIPNPQSSSKTKANESEILIFLQPYTLRFEKSKCFLLIFLLRKD